MKESGFPGSRRMPFGAGTRTCRLYRKKARTRNSLKDLVWSVAANRSRLIVILLLQFFFFASHPETDVSNSSMHGDGSPMGC